VTATVEAMRVADLVGVSAAVARHGATSAHHALSVPVFAYLVDDGFGKLTVFDLGCGPQGEPVAGRPRIENQRSVAEAVISLGRSPADVAEVVLSHLHWDHCVGVEGFPEARILVQRAELTFAATPPQQQEQQYDAAWTGRRASWLDHLDRVDAVEGRVALGPGVEIVPTPGHTAGSQSLLVRTADRDFLLCGDLFMSYEQWSLDPARREPPGLHSSLPDWHLSMAMVDELGCMPLPAHEPRVIEVLADEWSPR
jgi:N-acyl homoserine lactone hydrolase